MYLNMSSSGAYVYLNMSSSGKEENQCFESTFKLESLIKENTAAGGFISFIAMLITCAV